MKTIVPLGRILFSLIFILASFNHFTAGAVGYAAGQGVPFPEILVPASGLLALLGGLSILVGYYARIGAIMIVAFLLPVTFMMHNFWAVADPMMHAMQMAMFLKNVSMMGAALLLYHYGAGPFSVDERRR